MPLLRENRIECVIPQSIDWAQAPWADDLLRSGTPIFSPTGEGMRIERERDFARRLCREWRGEGRRPDSCVRVGPLWYCDY